MAVSSNQVALGSPAPEFRLRGIDGRTYSLKDVVGKRGTVIVFLCNHCLYVKAVIGRLVRDARELRQDAVGFAAICSNDAAATRRTPSRTCSASRTTTICRSHTF